MEGEEGEWKEGRGRGGEEGGRGKVKEGRKGEGEGRERGVWKEEAGRIMSSRSTTLSENKQW